MIFTICENTNCSVRAINSRVQYKRILKSFSFSTRSNPFLNSVFIVLWQKYVAPVISEDSPSCNIHQLVFSFVVCPSVPTR